MSAVTVPRLRYPNPYRGREWSTEQLLAQQEVLRYEMAELDCDGSPDDWCGESCVQSTLEFLALELKDCDDELKRRARLQASRFAPPWPNGKPVDRTALIAEIKRRLSVEELLRRSGVPLKQSGRRLLCRCPLPGHDDKTPSFTIFPDGGWYCFGCCRGGDVLELGRWLLNERSFVRAVDMLAREAGIRP
jgi:hypothetical protein